MLASIVSFSLIAVSAKELSADMQTAEIIFFRCLFGLIVLSAIVLVSGAGRVKTANFKKHILRNLTHFLGQYGWFYGIAFIPLAEVFALEFTVPVWTAIAGALLLKEKITGPRIVTIILGLIGVMVILRPTAEVIDPVAFVVLASAMAFGFSHTLTRSIVTRDSAFSVIFYMCLIQLPIALVLSLNSWVMPEGTMWFWLLLAGLSAMSAHYTLSKALALADAMVVIPMDFMRLPLIMLVGWYFYHEGLDAFLLLGAAIMLIGNYTNLRHERSRPKT
ncbi:MAG TPA: EamA family transporter [Porticoccaceae bacterium]|nr:EamA family transporter [Porticoccaceae bacterium]HCO61797.1 EamA family transporter [Porticoccaceae bacterium]